MDYFQLMSGVLVIALSAIPFYLAARVYRKTASFFFLSALLGAALAVHGVYRLWFFLGESLFASELELLSALLIFSLAVSYVSLRRSWR
jgi:ABC-type Mn2+/Zn2+ transport system permease subunit